MICRHTVQQGYAPAECRTYVHLLQSFQVLRERADKTLLTFNEMSYERLNAYHIMWLFVMFDLPVTTKRERKNATAFRKNLEKDGFVMHQFSVYMRHCGSLESAQVHIKRVRSLSPESGHISIVTITDKQYSNIVNIWGKVEKKARPLPLQLEFF